MFLMRKSVLMPRLMLVGIVVFAAVALAAIFAVGAAGIGALGVALGMVIAAAVPVTLDGGEDYVIVSVPVGALE